MSDFSKHTSLRGLLAPARFEADVYDCEVSGAIPADLDGAFYRMHGDWLYPPKYLDDISLAADGYVSSFRFRNGLVDYKGRYVRTDRFERQMQARRQLYGYYRNPYTDEPQVQDIANPGLRTTANTTPVSFNGQLLATKEDGLPYSLDPRTLATAAASPALNASRPASCTGRGTLRCLLTMASCRATQQRLSVGSADPSVLSCTPPTPMLKATRWCSLHPWPMATPGPGLRTWPASPLPCRPLRCAV